MTLCVIMCRLWCSEVMSWRFRRFHLHIVIRSDNHDETECCDLGTVSEWCEHVCVWLCPGAVGVWFGTEQASWGMWSWSQANLWEQRGWLLSACLPCLYLCVSVHTLPPYLCCSAGAQHGISWPPQGQGLPVCNPVHLRYKGEDHPTYTFMSYTSAEPLDIISLTNAQNKYNMNFTYL